MEEQQDKVTYKFERQATFSDGSIQTDVKMFTDEDYAKPWTDVLNGFCLWLGSIYGYDIARHIQVKGSSLEDAMDDGINFVLKNWPSDDFNPREGCEDCGDSLGSRQDRSGGA